MRAGKVQTCPRCLIDPHPCRSLVVQLCLDKRAEIVDIHGEVKGAFGYIIKTEQYNVKFNPFDILYVYVDN